MSNQRTRIVVLASGKGSNLQAIIDQIKTGSLNVEIAAVVSDVEDAFALSRAEKEKIPREFVNPKNFPDRQAYDDELVRIVRHYRPHLLVLAGFMRILTKSFVDQFESRIINIHPSLLPKYKGLNTHQRVLDANEKFHGATVHFVVPELDAGPVIVQAEVEVKSDDTSLSLQNRVHSCEHVIYPMAIQWYSENRLEIFDRKVLLDGKESPDQFIQCYSNGNSCGNCCQMY